MKKLFKSILILSLTLILLLQALPFAGAAEDSAEREEPTRAGQFIVVKSCYIFDEASASGNTVVWVSAGTQVTIPSGTWSYTSTSYIPVTYGAYSGYINAQYVCPKSTCLKVKKIAGATIYSGGGTSMGTLAYGTYAHNLGTTDSLGRYRVCVMSGSFDGTKGYVSPADFMFFE